jgi:drug/metabolite transporter (DMT)-like permease
VHAPYEKILLYQLLVSAPMLALAAELFGERVTAQPSAIAVGSLLYQTFWVAGFTFLAWFALIQRYSASRLSAFTFLTPLFGVAAGYIVLSEPLTPAFAAAVALVIAGLVLVNRPR